MFTLNDYEDEIVDKLYTFLEERGEFVDDSTISELALLIYRLIQDQEE